MTSRDATMVRPTKCAGCGTLIFATRPFVITVRNGQGVDKFHLGCGVPYAEAAQSAAAYEECVG